MIFYHYIYYFFDNVTIAAIMKHFEEYIFIDIKRYILKMHQNNFGWKNYSKIPLYIINTMCGKYR